MGERPEVGKSMKNLRLVIGSKDLGMEMHEQMLARTYSVWSPTDAEKSP